MLILNMILRITGFTQEELANYIGVSRASVNSWLSDDSNMSENSKKIICEKFQIPYNYFQVDLNQSLEYYKLVFSTLYENWKRIKNIGKNEDSNSKKINDILNQIDYDMNPICCEDIEEVEILEGLANGYNPYTGEVFENNHILNNENIQALLKKVYKYYINGKFELDEEDLDETKRELYEELRKWRKDKYIEEGYYNAYVVFNNRELINIVMADIKRKEDLIKVRGIGDKKYNKYSDELFEIIKNGKYRVQEKEELEPFEIFKNTEIEIKDEDLPF